MASDTVDPIDWLDPPPYTEEYPLSSTHCTVQCGLQITRLTALTEIRTCDLRTPGQRTACAATQGIELQAIIKRSTTCPSPEYTLKLIIYYKNLKSSSLLLKNNERKTSDLKNTNVVYEFICPQEECLPRPNVNYIGVTTISLSRRLTMHLANRAIKQHMEKIHKSSLNRLQLTKNTHIIKRNNVTRLQIAEAVIMKTIHSINRYTKL